MLLNYLCKLYLGSLSKSTIGNIYLICQISMFYVVGKYVFSNLEDLKLNPKIRMVPTYNNK